MNCTISIYLAYAMTIYCLACIMYIAFTRCMTTPFMDSLSHSQKQILEKARYQRRNVFMVGVALSSYLMFYVQPFKKCVQIDS